VALPRTDGVPPTFLSVRWTGKSTVQSPVGRPAVRVCSSVCADHPGGIGAEERGTGHGSRQQLEFLSLHSQPEEAPGRGSRRDGGYEPDSVSASAAGHFHEVLPGIEIGTALEAETAFAIGNIGEVERPAC